MKIALDFDETITLDRSFWGSFIELAKTYKHEVVIVTSRPEALHDPEFNIDIEAYAKGWEVIIIYANFKQKKEVYNADVWIDDAPESIPTYNKLHVELG